MEKSNIILSSCWEPIINLKKELEMLADFEIEYDKRLKKP